MILQEAQELGLGAQTEGLDFVQEQGSPFRLGDQAGLSGPGASEGPLRMPEQFALEQLHRDGPTVDRQKGLPGPAAEIVQGPCTQSFARAGLTGEEHGGLTPRQQGELPLQGHEGRILAYQLR